MLKNRLSLFALTALLLPLTVFARLPRLVEHSFGPVGISATAVKLADLNGNGLNDSVLLAVGRHDGGQNYICHFRRATTDLVCEQPLGYPSSASIGIEAAHLEHNARSGHKDIVVANGDCHSSRCQYVSAAVAYLASEHYQVPHALTRAKGARSIAVGDIDNNGYDDIILGFAGRKQNLLLLNQGNMNFREIRFPNLGTATMGIKIYHNSKGKAFIVVTSRAHWSSSNVPHKNAVYRFEHGHLQLISQFGQNLQSMNVAVGRLTGCDQNYIVVGNGGQSNRPAQMANIWRVSADGVVAPSPITTAGKLPQRARPVLLYDVNGNGLNDIIVGNLNRASSNPTQYSMIYLNNGGLNFTPITIPGSNIYEPRGMDIGKTVIGTVLLSANYCSRMGAGCQSRYYTFY
ncbi:MAG: VCBS repeat-containing protein [Coxiellaceae bacterium]|nr:VCBS repeat-containing protein [Coxiellaceae bacterium]